MFQWLLGCVLGRFRSTLSRFAEWWNIIGVQKEEEGRRMNPCRSPKSYCRRPSSSPSRVCQHAPFRRERSERAESQIASVWNMGLCAVGLLEVRASGTF